MESFAKRIMSFNRQLEITSRLPKGVAVMNPYREHEHALQWSDAFYTRYYNDVFPRRLILGINPGRLGAGQTGIPFTDTKRLWSYFSIGNPHEQTHESSSAFVYRMIDAYGGVELFYRYFLISSLCPLGFVLNKDAKPVNYNYYDSPQLLKAVKPFMVRCMEEQLRWPIDRSVVYCLGTGKNHKFLEQLNKEYRWFEKIVPLEHPRYVMQYKSGRVEEYIQKYLKAFSAVR
ncbi:MAG: uracil-DNA glycosylase family protein [Flavobacteriales bacterium]|jgi:hypothetical protein